MQKADLMNYRCMSESSNVLYVFSSENLKTQSLHTSPFLFLYVCVPGLVVSRQRRRGRIAGTPGNRGKLKFFHLTMHIFTPHMEHQSPPAHGLFDTQPQIQIVSSLRLAAGELITCAMVMPRSCHVTFIKTTCLLHVPRSQTVLGFW